MVIFGWEVENTLTLADRSIQDRLREIKIIGPVRCENVDVGSIIVQDRYGQTICMAEEVIQAMNESFEEVSPGFMCDHCEQMLLSGPGLDRHTKKVHGTGNASYKCGICSAMFMERGHYMGHINVHADVKPYKCSKCNRATYAYRSSLPRHRKVCTGPKEPEKGTTPYTCNLCDYKTPRKDTLKEHISAKHNQEKRYGCKVCNKHFKYRSSLSKHRSTH
ncbi:zinc finger protein 578-like [Pecten maximus]|uniref:zinc finger protein 578-like n=1 Tax=Pecten maximus TaxID=6579 RepID=UPI001458A1EE|nr:zinc finger protein 578-like [Pecten maximus]